MSLSRANTLLCYVCFVAFNTGKPDFGLLWADPAHKTHACSNKDSQRHKDLQ